MTMPVTLLKMSLNLLKKDSVTFTYSELFGIFQTFSKQFFCRPAMVIASMYRNDKKH